MQLKASCMEPSRARWPPKAQNRQGADTEANHTTLCGSNVRARDTQNMKLAKAQARMHHIPFCMEATHARWAPKTK